MDFHIWLSFFDMWSVFAECHLAALYTMGSIIFGRSIPHIVWKLKRMLKNWAYSIPIWPIYTFPTIWDWPICNDHCRLINLTILMQHFDKILEILLLGHVGMLIHWLKKSWIAKSETPTLSFSYPELRLWRCIGLFILLLKSFWFCDPRLFKSWDYNNFIYQGT